MLRILGRVSSINVRKVLWTCDEIGLAYAREDWGSGFASTDAPEFRALNPNGLVPVIEDEAGVLWESNTICRYLAIKAERTDLLPVDPRGRALIEQWMDWQVTALNGPGREAFLGIVRCDPAFQEPDRRGASLRAWNAAMAVLERQLDSTGVFVLGPVFSLADIVLGLWVNRWRLTPMERPDYPAVAAYYGRLSQRSGFQAWGGDAMP